MLFSGIILGFLKEVLIWKIWKFLVSFSDIFEFELSFIINLFVELPNMSFPIYSSFQESQYTIFTFLKLEFELAIYKKLCII
jgi:hypothetical protein